MSAPLIFMFGWIDGSTDLQPDIFVNETIFGPPGEGDTFWQITVTGGAASVQPSLIVDSDVFFSPTVLAGPVIISPSLYLDSDTFHTPTISRLFTLQPSLFTDTDTIFSHTLSQGVATLSPSLYLDSDIFLTPVVQGGVATLLPTLYNDLDTFYTPVINATKTLTASFFSDSDTIFPFSIGRPPIAPDLYVDIDTFYPIDATFQALRAKMPKLFTKNRARPRNFRPPLYGRFG